MSNPQPPYGQQPPAPWSPYPGSEPAGGYPQQGYPGYPQQGGYAPPSTYPRPEAYPPQQPGVFAPPSGYGQQPGGYAPNFYAPPPPPLATQTSRNNVLAGAFAVLGGLGAVIGFVALPYYSISGSDASGNAAAYHVSAHAFTHSTITDSAYSGYPELWGVLGGAALIVLIGAALAMASQSGSGSQGRSLAIALLAVGVIDIGILFRVFFDFNHKISQYTGGVSPAGVTYGFDFGFWLTAAGLILAIIGGGIALTRTNH